jgi:RimJ/RimL family protein N-acetyltransferase
MGPVVFSSRRFDMRRWDRTDVDAAHPILGDPRVVWWDPDTGDLDHTRGVLERVVGASDREPGGRGWFAVVARDAHEAVANVVLRTPAVDAEGLELGWHVAYEHWGGGIATEAAQAALAHGRSAFGVRTFVALIEPANEPSLRVAVKLGMRHERDVEYADAPHRLYRVDA